MSSPITPSRGFSYFAKSGMATQPERLETAERHSRLVIAVPCESILQENRVALIPSSVGSLVARGHEVWVERCAGDKSGFTDQDYSEAGAQLMDDREQLFKADVLVKITPPTLEEARMMHHGQLLISPLQLSIIDKQYIQTLVDKQVVAIAMEYMKDSDGTFPVVRTMSEMAGISAVLTAAELLSNNAQGGGILLGGISGVPPAKVIILGAGVVGEHATRAALGLGAQVSIFDNNVYKLMRIQQRVGRQLYTSSLNPHYLEQEILCADVVIGAIHAEHGRSPMVVTEDLVMMMKKGAVIIDVSIDQGGCIETSEITTHSHPTFVKHGVTHYCVPNIASRAARTGSIAVSNILTPILLQMADHGRERNMFYAHHGWRHGVYVYKGCVTNEYLASRFGFKYVNLDLLITTNM